MKTTRFTTGAEAEYGRAIAYYEGKKEGLGVDFQTEVERTVNTIRRVPGLGAPFKKTVIGFLGYAAFLT